MITRQHSKISELQYIDLCNRILNEGSWVRNDRTGKRCLTVIDADLNYTVADFPILTIRKSYWKAAIAEILGYLRGYTDAQQFADLGANTWFANANKNKSWLINPFRKGENDMGRVYGAQMRDWKLPQGGSVDQLVGVVKDLIAGYDDRGEILQMWNPGEFHMGCLRPCLFQWQFSILDEHLYVHAYQRSCDVPLGLNFNMIQVWFMLWVMSAMTGLKPGGAYHKIVNAHIYEDQLDQVRDMLRNDVSPHMPVLKFNSDSVSLDYVLNGMTPNDFTLEGYPEDAPVIKFPFSV